MNRLKAMLGGLVVIFMSGSLSAAMITNGDFANSCSFAGWQTETDFFEPELDAKDFTIDGAAPNCTASINIDYVDTAAEYGNILWQNLDLSADIGSTFLLTMDFSVFSQANNNDPGFIADYFIVDLFDGSNFYNQFGKPGFLVADTSIEGSQNYSLSFELDNSFANQTGWSLEFQLLPGFDNVGSDYFGSTLAISNVSLTEQKVAVPAPSSFALFALGLFGLAARRKSI